MTAPFVGISASEIIGRPINARAPSGQEREMSVLMERIRCGERISHFETKCRRKDGEIIIVSVAISPTAGRSGVVTGASTVARDITEQKRAERDFQESEALNRAVLNSLPANIAVVDGEGIIRTVNDGWKKFARENRDQSVMCVGAGENYLEVCRRSAKDGRTEARAALAGMEAVLSGKRPSFEMLYACTSDGQTRWFRMIVSHLSGAAGAAVIVYVDYTQLKQAGDELRALSGRLLLAQEEERRRIARELHDDLCQKIALLAIDTSSLAMTPTSLPDETRQSLDNLQTQITQLGTDVRQISHDLHPSILEDLGLLAALRELCEEFSVRTTIHAVFEQRDVPETVPVEIEACLYRLAQEALHNVQKHAWAGHVWVTLSGSPNSVDLCIQDDGIGFNVHSSSRSMGIVSMKERVRLVEGEFSIHSQPGQGTTLTAVVPLAKRLDEAHAITVSE